MNTYMTQKRLDRQFKREQDQIQLDSMAPADAANKLGDEAINEREAIAVTSQMRIKALYVIFMLAAMLSDEDYNGEDLLPSEALDSLMTEAFVDRDDDSDDGSTIDQYVRATFSAHVSDALSTMGVDDSVIQDVFDDDVEVADAAVLVAAEVVLEGMPEDGQPFEDFVAAFAYSDDIDAADSEEDAASFDSMSEPEYQFDAAGKKLRVGKKTVKKVNGKTLVYKAVKAIRNGKKVTINKRMEGTPLLKASQKAALKKARRKAGTATAVRKQIKSFGKGMRMNLYKGNPKRLAALKRAGSARYFNS